ncbi:hypothetical protein [Carboxylicivirga sp. RSCT41]|uniref:hypothetical protein n=1 Tax=Carboxylicivirga agarovorans TaxID=3417570 RepID=UPI003D32D550
MSIRKSFYLLAFILAFTGLNAQDAHYWTEQYGARSMLLSNSIVGSVSDLGAVFYNPGRLGLIEQPAFLISAKVHELNRTTFENATGENKDLKKSEFGGVPSLVSGTFKLKWLPGHKFAYAFLTRNRSDLSFSTRSELYGDVIDKFPGEEYFSGNIAFNKKFNEEWLGGTWSKDLSENFSIGFSGFFTTRNQRSSIETKLQAYTSDEVLETFRNINSYSYSHYGLLGKLGIAYQSKRIKAGVTFTTPTMRLAGDGDFYYELFNTAYNENNSTYELNTQSKIDAYYKTPWSMAAGIGVDILWGTFHASTEYYSGVDRHTIMQAEPFIAQSTSIERTASVVNELNSVLNYGFGYNIDINENIAAYMSYSTDFSAAVGDFDTVEGKENLNYIASTFKADITHLGFGVLMDFSWADLTLGATRANAKYTVDRPIDFPDEDGNMTANNDISRIDWQRWRFILSLSIPFLNKAADKLNLDD